MADSIPFDHTLADKFPHDVARLLEEADPSDSISYLKQLPPQTAALVGSNLSARRWAQMLRGLDTEVQAMLERAHINDALVLLNRLPGSERSRLVAQIEDKSRQTELLRILAYPAHCVGAVVRTPTCVFRSKTTKAEVVTELRRNTPLNDTSAVVVDLNSRYVGVLDPWLLLVRGSDGGEIGNCVRTLPTLRPERRQEDAASLPIWESQSWLPVVDREQRLLGICRRTDLSIRETTPLHEDVRLSDSVYEGLGELTDIVLGKGGS